MFFSPRHRQGAAIHQNNHQRLARRGDCLQQILLQLGQVDLGSVASTEALQVHRHLLSFEAGRQAYESYYYICLARDLDRLVAHHPCVRLPPQVRAGAKQGRGVGILHPDCMRCRIAKVHVEGSGGLLWIAARLQYQFVVEIKTVMIDTVASKTIFLGHFKDVIAGAGHSNETAPANTECIGRDTLGRGGGVPIKIYLLVDPGQHWLPLPVSVVEVFALEPKTRCRCAKQYAGPRPESPQHTMSLAHTALC